MGVAADNYRRMREQVAACALRAGRPENAVRLLAVSKRFPPEAIRDVYQAGCRMFGESRPQELRDKTPLLPSDIAWHFIGPLQKNKIKYVARNAALIHAVDTLELARALSEYAVRHNLVLRVLAEYNMSGEPAKHGFDPRAGAEPAWAMMALPGLELRGFMTLAPRTDDAGAISRAFAGLRNIAEKAGEKADVSSFELSMGMSGDYEIAIKEGSTLVRIGSAIFGPRR
ncbi:MAG: YggS family pyridoxal phosphate-dependent enzyme [Calditrichaeota bacterium]|nr:MAG: YggS family pyridoxal phosphate-dependent enzyme [Calditrichota bacterium]